MVMLETNTAKKAKRMNLKFINKQGKCASKKVALVLAGRIYFMGIVFSQLNYNNFAYVVFFQILHHTAFHIDCLCSRFYFNNC